MKHEITVTPGLRRVAERLRQCSIGNEGRLVYKGDTYMLKGTYYGWLFVYMKRSWRWRKIAEILFDGAVEVYMSEKDLPFLRRAVSSIEAGVAMKRSAIKDAMRVESETIDSLLNL